MEASFGRQGRWSTVQNDYSDLRATQCDAYLRRLLRPEHQKKETSMDRATTAAFFRSASQRKTRMAYTKRDFRNETPRPQRRSSTTSLDICQRLSNGNIAPRKRMNNRASFGANARNLFSIEKRQVWRLDGRVQPISASRPQSSPVAEKEEPLHCDRETPAGTDPPRPPLLPPEMIELEDLHPSIDTTKKLATNRRNL